MAIKTRKQCREQLGILLDTALTGAGNPAQDVYDYMKSDFQHQSPIVTIGSEGFSAGEQDFDGNWTMTYYYSVNVFVTRNTASGYTEEDVEDLVDSVMQKTYETLLANRSLADYWNGLAIDGRSEIMPAKIGGDPYWMETIPVALTIYGDA